MENDINQQLENVMIGVEKQNKLLLRLMTIIGIGFIAIGLGGLLLAMLLYMIATSVNII